MRKNQKIVVKGIPVTVFQTDKDDYISRFLQNYSL